MKSYKETAEILGVHWQTVRNWVKSGKVKSVQLGRSIKISEEEIERVKKEGIR